LSHYYAMSPKKPVDPISDKLRKLKKKPVSTYFTLLIDQDKPDSQPKLQFITQHSFADCKCSCEKAKQRFDPSKYVISDGIFALSIMCSTHAAVTRAVREYEKIRKLESPTQTKSRQAALKPLIVQFASTCEHRKILRKVVERPHHFVAYPMVPKSRVDQDGFPMTESDTDSDEEDEKADRGDEEADAPVSANSLAINPRRTINDELIAKLLQKLPRSRRVHTSEMSGYIYILKSPRIRGYLKIGVTTKDPVVRREQWDRCYPTIELHAYTSKVPYASLVEGIIHTELLIQRHMEDCSSCKGKKIRARSHTEWFKVTEQLAEQVVLRWSKWMGSRPYHADTRKLSQTWVDRLKKAREKGYKPGIDHIPSREATWQNFTDMRRPKGGKDDSGAIELIKCKIEKSPFSE
jgi:hypothetical protein